MGSTTTAWTSGAASLVGRRSRSSATPARDHVVVALRPSRAEHVPRSSVAPNSVSIRASPVSRAWLSALSITSSSRASSPSSPVRAAHGVGEAVVVEAEARLRIPGSPWLVSAPKLKEPPARTRPGGGCPRLRIAAIVRRVNSVSGPASNAGQPRGAGAARPDRAGPRLVDQVVADDPRRCRGSASATWRQAAA